MATEVAVKKPVSAKTMPYRPLKGMRVFFWQHQPNGIAEPMLAFLMGKGKTGYHMNVVHPGNIMSFVNDVQWIAGDTPRVGKTDPKMGCFSFEEEIPEELLAL